MFNNNGVVNSYYIQHIHRTEELNERINERNIPLFQTTQNLGLRSVPTKHTLMKIYDERKSKDTTNTTNDTISQHYLSNIDVESELRRQNTRLGCDDANKYIPASNSDMYQSQVNENIEFGRNQPFQDLFKEQDFSQYNDNTVFNVTFGRDLFNNHTRQQLKDN